MHSTGAWWIQTVWITQTTDILGEERKFCTDLARQIACYFPSIPAADSEGKGGGGGMSLWTRYVFKSRDSYPDDNQNVFFLSTGVLASLHKN